MKDVFTEQVRNVGKGDFTEQVRKDLKEVGLNLTFSQITSLPKMKFKSMVKVACNNACFNELQRNRQSLSKGKQINYSELKIQAYLKPGNGLSLHDMRKIYYLRCRENNLKCNYPNSFDDTNCVAAPKCSGQDSEIHIYSCPYLSTPNQLTSEIVKYEHIFGDDIPRQTQVMNIFYQNLKKRNTILLSDLSSGTPVDPSRGGGRGRRGTQPRLGIREAKRIHKKIKQKVS